MTEEPSFPKRAAYFCLAAPFIASMAQNIAGDSASNSELSRDIMLFVYIAILGCGFILGIYSLFFSKKIKGILIPASIGILFHLATFAIAIGAYYNYRSTYKYFTVSSQMNTSELSYEQIIFGRIHPSAPTDTLFNSITNGILESCPSCKILETKINKSVPDQYKGIFDNAQLNVTYVSIDTGNRASGDMRIILPGFDPQLSCQQLEAFVNQKKEMVGKNGVVSCVDAAN